MIINYSYLLLVSFFFFLAYYDNCEDCEYRTSTTNCQIIASLSYLVFWGLRGFIGTDCFWYFEWFKDLNTNLLDAFADRIDLEPGYITYAYFFKYYVWNNFHAFVFFSTLLNIIFLYFIFKKSESNMFIFSLAIFCVFSANSEINNLRNIRAILLFYISIKYIEEKRFFPFLLIQILGILFHSTAIFFIPLYFIISHNLKKWILPIVTIGFFMVLFELSPLVSVINKIGEMMGGSYLVKALLFLDVSDTKGFTFGALTRLSIGYLLWYFYDDLCTPRKRIYCNLALLYLFCFSFFNEIPVFRLRFSMMFAPALCVVFPLFIEYAQIQYKRIITIYLCLVILLQAVVNFQGPLFVYDNLIWGIEDVNNRINKLN